MAPEGEVLKQRLSLISPAKRVVVTVAATALLAAAVSPPLSTASTAQASSKVPTIYIKGSSAKSLRFVGPKTIKEGEELRIVNDTNAHHVGPQTFSLVEESELPKTEKERKLCLSKGHICKAIESWQGIRRNGPAKVNPVEAGEEGWSTLGTSKTKGDSWFTGDKPHASFQQRVHAGATTGPFTLSFMSALDPALRGQITVEPESQREG